MTNDPRTLPRAVRDAGRDAVVVVVVPDGSDSRTLTVADTAMHHLESGLGRPVVFLHGNPTSSCLWRAVLPQLTGRGLRLIALDLVGMGASGKPDIGYRLHEHVGHVAGVLDGLGLTGATVVAHDWGVAIIDAAAADWCRRTQPGLEVADVGATGHFLPEDRPTELAAVLARWLDPAPVGGGSPG